MKSLSSLHFSCVVFFPIADILVKTNGGYVVSVCCITSLPTFSLGTMGRGYIVEEAVEGYLSKLCDQQAGPVTGLLIGQVRSYNICPAVAQ